MKVKDAVTILNDDASTAEQLQEAHTTFLKAGLKSLAAKALARTKPAEIPFERRGMDFSIAALMLQHLMQNPEYVNMAAQALRNKAAAALGETRTD